MICIARRHQKIIPRMADAVQKRLACRLARNLARCNSAASTRRVLKDPDSRLRSCNGGGVRGEESAVGWADELLVSSSLKCTSGPRHANIDCRPFLTPGPDPFPSLAAGLIFFFYLFIFAGTLFTSDDDDDDDDYVDYVTLKGKIRSLN